jgi:thiamine-monophosphate kinase
MTASPLGPGPEFDRIRAIASGLGALAAGLGDDCAILDLGGTTLALSTDVSVEEIHFRREWLSLEEIGWRAAAGSLSDLAAAGAEPIGVLAALTMPEAEPPSAFESIMAGVGAAVGSVGGVVLGGDLSRGAAVSLAITSIGRAPRPMRRRGARAGDGLWVTGELGGARAALLAWKVGRDPDPAARARFAHPEPRIETGRWLAGNGATAMMDVSDGLAGDARHLAAASRVSLRIDLDRVPRHPSVAALAQVVGESPASFAARGGEDYELLFTLPGTFLGRPAGGVALTRIGSVEEGEPGRVIMEENGAPVTLTGYDHFA